MKNFFYTLICTGGLCLFLFMPKPVNAQATNAGEEGAFWGKSEAYLHNQAFHMFGLIDQALTENPPVTGAPMARKLALYTLDAMLHETKYDNSEPFNHFLLSRVNKVVADLCEPVSEGMKIYKVYNDGFVVRTPSAAIAFDLVRGSCNGQTMIPDSLIARIVDQCDALFITHNHGDHGDPVVADLFLKAGKPVIAPTNLWEKNKEVQHLRFEQPVEKQLTLGRGQSVAVKIFPGHQSELINNIYVVTMPEKQTIAHIGDQYNKEDMEWIVDIHKEIPSLDVLVVNCWTHRMNDLVEGFKPKLVVTGHENEMGHTIDHREAFWLTFQKMEAIKRDYLVMGWGEFYQITK
ncbi:MBL fold metallo-hydrolase [Parabacteroides sp. PF5-9]|uniref:MBL fold metallo-hydrolase n=1 Tax=Parabacteroides sp. PF5-9 TaxID=1742404 RepID=UPI0024766EBA|nr:MBL fold metallo-hydrolase [Parabacteroides sp. PF5-9]MDH6358513.1 L-ascorbate metabolism protein UlaG (beta-lactamase superfamily) [Parabacteroides sp. PF5-9]